MCDASFMINYGLAAFFYGIIQQNLARVMNLKQIENGVKE